MKKSFLLLFVFLLSMGILSGCSGLDPQPGSTSPDVSAPLGDSSAEEKVTVGQQVIYDENNIKITLTDFGSDLVPAAENVITPYGAWLVFKVENNTEMDLSVNCPFAMMNGVMLMPMFQSYPEAGQILEGETAYFDYHEMIDANLSTIGSVDFVLVIADTAQTFSDVKYVNLTTSASDFVQPEYIPDSTPILDDNGLKAYYLGSTSDGYSLIYKLYVTNSTENMVIVTINDPMADGTTLKDAADPYSGHTFPINETLFPHCAAYVNIQVQTGDDGYAGPEQIGILSGTLMISQYGDDNTVYANAQISLPWECTE